MENMTNNNVPKTIIKCPHCGHEHLLEEVFYEDDIIGMPTDVVRDPIGKILYVSWNGDAPTYKETYCCDHCGKPFIAELKIVATAYKEEEALDFSNLTSSLF